MTPFVKVARDATESLIHREVLLAQPPEFFCGFFGGRVPTIYEKLFFVEQAVQRMTSLQIYENDVYRVEAVNSPPFVHLDICRHDGLPCKNWRDFQRIKNELVGPDLEAVELFPAESRLVDTSNQYHLWVHTDPNYRFPFGFLERLVLSTPLRYHLDATQADAPANERDVAADRIGAQHLAAGTA